MLATKSLAGVAPEVNLKNPSSAGNEGLMERKSTLAMRSRVFVTKNPKHRGSQIPLPFNSKFRIFRKKCLLVAENFDLQIISHTSLCVLMPRKKAQN